MTPIATILNGDWLEVEVQPDQWIKGVFIGKDVNPDNTIDSLDRWVIKMRGGYESKHPLRCRLISK